MSRNAADHVRRQVQTLVLVMARERGYARVAMDLECHRRFKHGKEHRYWSIAEKRRLSRGRVIDRHVLYLGEINDSQREDRIEAHIFVAFLAYCVHVNFKHQLKAHESRGS